MEKYGDRVYTLCPGCAKFYEEKYGMLKPHENVSEVRKQRARERNKDKDV
jgi:hypothetical protein